MIITRLDCVVISKQALRYLQSTVGISYVVISVAPKGVRLLHNPVTRKWQPSLSLSLGGWFADK